MNAPEVSFPTEPGRYFVLRPDATAIDGPTGRRFRFVEVVTVWRCTHGDLYMGDGARLHEDARWFGPIMPPIGGIDWRVYDDDPAP